MMHHGLKSHRRPDRPFLPRSARWGNVRPCPIPPSEQSVAYWSSDTASHSITSSHGQEACTTYKHVPGIVGEKSSSSPAHAPLRRILARLFYPARSCGLGISDIVCDLPLLPRLVADSYSPSELWSPVRSHLWARAHTTAMARLLSRHKRESG